MLLLLLGCGEEEPLTLERWREAETRAQTHELVDRVILPMGWEEYLVHRSAMLDIATSEHYEESAIQYWIQRNAVWKLREVQDFGALKQTAYSQPEAPPEKCERSTDGMHCIAWFTMDVECLVRDPRDGSTHLREDPVCRIFYPNFKTSE